MLETWRESVKAERSSQGLGQDRESAYRERQFRLLPMLDGGQGRDTLRVGEVWTKYR